MRPLHFLPVCIFLLSAWGVRAQSPPVPGNPITLQNAPQRDTTNRSSKAGWRDEPVRISSTMAFSLAKSYPDTSIHNFQRRPFLQPWYRDLGNHGTPAYSQVFIPDNLGITGPSLGYHVFDVYTFRADSLRYYNTTRPYTAFSYQLGSKLEQTLHILHTQNITSRWNFSAQYQKIGSQGFYNLQRTNHDAGALSTHYTSANQQYELYGAAVYNKEQSDENGGILDDSLLSDARYTDRQTIPVALDNPSYYASSSEGRRSSITNVMRDFNVLLQHQYTWGHRDTIYNKDSTSYKIMLAPRFSIAHRFEAGSAKHKTKDIAPDSLFYASFFNRSFATADSVYSEQYWSWIDNRVSLNGFAGPPEKQLSVSAGVGNRLDNFHTTYISGQESNSIISTYLTGDIRKEAVTPKTWGYEASGKFTVTGAAAGDFLLKGTAEKNFGRKIGSVRVGALQQLTDAPYSFTLYRNQYFREEASLAKESITMLWANVSNDPLGITIGFRNYVIGNYIYLTDSFNRVTNGRLEFSQDNGAFNLSQLSLRKVFRIRRFVIDNEMVLQQATDGAPLSVPLLLGRHALSFEKSLFANALKIATGVEVRYHSDYKAEGYAPFYNRFYYQNSYTSENKPELNLFFNFKVKRFRAFLMGDQVQALFWRNTIIDPHYPSQNPMLRFGFNWVLVN